MLTISAPIEIKAKTTYLHDPEAFYHRITGNYSLMESRIDEEDLLHIATTPPEIYVTEGEGMSSILNLNQHRENNIQKVEIINNVLNRIIASADVNLTYQDRVFITDALYKLGVKDDRRFMKAFYQMAEETKNTNTLISLYLENSENLTELVETIENRQKEITKTDTKTLEREKENYLFTRVMNRLKTGAIYQIVSNFNRSSDETIIDHQEYSISDQTYTAQQVLLSLLRKRSGAGENLVFYNTNFLDEFSENQETNQENVRNNITQAVLMGLLKNIYHVGYDKFYGKTENYFSFEDTFFRSSEETFLRLLQGQQEDIYLDNLYSELISQNLPSEEAEIKYLENAPEGEAELTDEEAVKITQAINTVNIQNEKRRQEYVKALETVTKKYVEASDKSGFEKTKKDAVLALTNPQALREELAQRQEKRKQKQDLIFKEMRTLFPDRGAEIYQLVNEYYGGDVSLVENNIVRPAELGELIYDINQAERENSTPYQQKKAQNEETRQFLEELKKTRQEEKKKKARKNGFEEPVETIHRRTDSLSEEELNEQISELKSSITKQIKSQENIESITENRVNTQKQVQTTETTNTQISSYDIERMIEDGVKSQMNTISNQVINKLERQMRNEKIRRGYT